MDKDAMLLPAMLVLRFKRQRKQTALLFQVDKDSRYGPVLLPVIARIIMQKKRRRMRERFLCSIRVCICG